MHPPMVQKLMLSSRQEIVAKPGRKHAPRHLVVILGARACHLDGRCEIYFGDGQGSLSPRSHVKILHGFHDCCNPAGSRDTQSSDLGSSISMVHQCCSCVKVLTAQEHFRFSTCHGAKDSKAYRLVVPEISEACFASRAAYTSVHLGEPLL